eukprot:13172935-Heterocapsa_arctica.AAC.1
MCIRDSSPFFKHELAAVVDVQLPRQGVEDRRDARRHGCATRRRGPALRRQREPKRQTGQL